MSRKRKQQDSLELFLDTICNMFGGFLFLMLFVVVSIRSTRESTLERLERERQGVSAVELETMKLELNDLRQRWEKTSTTIENAKKLVGRLNDPEVAKVYREALDRTEEFRKISSANASTSEKIASIKRRDAELTAEQTRLEQELASTRSSVSAQLEKQLETRRASSRKTSAPQMRPSFKEEIVVILKYGKLYFWKRHDGTDWTDELNEDDFFVVSETASETRTEPRPQRGLDLNAPDVNKALDAAFSRCNTNRHRISLVVSSDSYAEYAIARDYLKRNLFDIRPVVGKEGTYVADRGGYGGKAQ